MRLGDYQVVSELGRGGMGVVALARAPDGREVAIKVVRHDRTREKKLDEFQREARLLGTLGEEAGFVPLLDQGVAPQGPYLVMPFLRGGTLRERLRNGPLPVREAVAIGREIARAVGRAHEKGIVHRDLKPENVLFTKDGKNDGDWGRPLVADLGIAKHFSDSSPGASQSVSLTREGAMKGTAGYMAPEQMMDAKNVGPPADVFALGAILYECLTGEPAFAAENVVALFARVESGDFKRPSETGVPVPAWLEAALVAALEHDPAHRPKDGAAFALLLEEPPARATPRRAIVALVALLVAAALVVGSLAALRLLRAPAPPPPPPPRHDDPASVDSRLAVAPPVPRAPPKVFASFVDSENKRFHLLDWWSSLRWKSAFPVYGVAFSPDGNLLASCGGEWECRLWDAHTGEDMGVTGGARSPVLCLAFSLDGRRITTGAKEGRVRNQPPELTKDHQILADHASPVVALAYSPDGRKVYSVSEDGAILARPTTETKIVRVPAHGGAKVVSVAFSPDRSAAILVGEDGKAHLRTTEGAGKDLVLSLEDSVNTVCYLPAESLVLFGAGAEPILYDPTADAIVKRFPPADGRIHALAVAPDGATFAAAADGGLFLWDRASGARRATPAHSGPVTAVAFSPTGDRLASGGMDRTVRIWQTATGKLVGAPEESGGNAALAAARDGTRFVSGTWDGEVRLWTARDHEPRVLATHSNAILTTAMSAKGDRAVSGDADGVVEVVDTATGAAVLRTERGPPVRSVAIAAAGDVVAALGDEPALKVWDVSAKAIAKSIPLAAGGVSVSLSSDAKRAAVVVGREVAVYDLASGEQRGSLALIHPGKACAFSPDGTLVAAGDEEGQITFWHVGQDMKVRSDAKMPIISVAFAVDGSRLYALSYDRRVHVWTVPPGAKEEDSLWFKTTADTPVTIAPVGDGGFYVGTIRGLILRYEGR